LGRLADKFALAGVITCKPLLLAYCQENGLILQTLEWIIA
jgi:hypothetical protein